MAMVYFGPMPGEALYLENFPGQALKQTQESSLLVTPQLGLGLRV